MTPTPDQAREALIDIRMAVSFRHVTAADKVDAYITASEARVKELEKEGAAHRATSEHVYKTLMDKQAIAAIQEALDMRDEINRAAYDNAMWFDALKVDYDALTAKLQEAIRLMGPLLEIYESCIDIDGTICVAALDDLRAIAQFVKENT